MVTSITGEPCKQRWGRLKSAIFDQYLAIFQIRCEIGISNTNRNSYVLYRMVLFLVTSFSDPNANHPISIFCIALHIFIVSGPRDFKMGK